MNLITDPVEDHGCCNSCHLVLHEPFVKCHQCKTSDKVFICLDCLAKGREFGKHKKTHKFSIVKSDFSVLEQEWSAKEEVRLLEALIHNGEGNWDEICKSLPSKTPFQCQHHYEQIYLDNESGDFPVIQSQVGPRHEQAVLCVPSESFSTATNMARPIQRSALHKDLAGYNAARGDFDWESDNLAEMELNVIQANSELFHFIENDGMQYVVDRDSNNQEDASEEDDILMAALSTSALQVYNGRLKKRLRRKRIVRELGLLNKPRAIGLPRRYPMISSSGSKYDHVFKMGKILCSFDFDFILEGLEHELELRQQILRFQEYRQNGLDHPVAAAFYTKLKSQREQELRERPRETVLDYLRSAKTKVHHLRANPLMTMTTRRTAGPLDIVGLPSYEKLTEEERDVCSDSRVLPEVFLEIKDVLVEECKKSDGLRLADARPLVKIDVNKTRKLYDFLLKKELIYAPQTTKSERNN
jgi:transcriptional adapter 2-alpha